VISLFLMLVFPNTLQKKEKSPSQPQPITHSTKITFTLTDQIHRYRALSSYELQDMVKYLSLSHNNRRHFQKTHLIMELPPHKLIVIAGPTASGKSDLAIKLAHQLDGEIISADSRQVYRGMDIGTGKVPRDFDLQHNHAINAPYMSGGIHHHLIDVASPSEEYNISHFLHDANVALLDIATRGKQPIICGGTHFWMQALIEDTLLPAVPPNPTLRAELSSKTTEELFTFLKEQDPKRAQSIDSKNPLRLIRALEIISVLGRVPPHDKQKIQQETNNRPIILVLNPPKEILRERINTRLTSRFEAGMIEEVTTLHQTGVSWEHLESFGLEYRFIAQFLQGKIDEATMQTELASASWHYARRQLSFLRRWERQGADLIWTPDSEQALENILKLRHIPSH
jgi:tRNA dimethylallyltransferase